MADQKVFADITTSLDGFITGPNDSLELGLGEGGERLHEWVYDLASWREPHGMEGGKKGTDSDVMEETVARSGAGVMGRRMFDHGEEPWGDDPPFHNPVFVVTHRGRDPLEKKGGTTFHFVTEGIESAITQAREAAGDKDVPILGGASLIQQAIKAGLLDEIQIHVAPFLMGAGVRLFDRLGTDQIEFEIDRVIESPAATHLRYRLVR